MTSEATVMSNPVWRGKPLATPPKRRHGVPERAVVHVDHAAPGDPTLVDLQLVAPVDMIVDHRAQSRLCAAVIAWKSPVKWRFISSIGTTCA